MEFIAEIKLFVSYEADTPEQAEQFLENYKEALAKTPKTNGLEFGDYHLSFEPYAPVFTCQCCFDGLATELFQNEQICADCLQSVKDVVCDECGSIHELENKQMSIREEQAEK